MTTTTNTPNKKPLTISELSERLAFLEQVYGPEYNTFDLPEAAKAFIQGDGDSPSILPAPKAGLSLESLTAGSMGEALAALYPLMSRSKKGGA